MALKVKPVREIAEQWAEGCARAVVDALQNPVSPKHYDWALAFASSNIRKLARGEGRQAHLTLSAALMERAGLKPGDRVLVLPLSEGGLLVRRASGEEIVAAHRLYAKRRPNCECRGSL